MRRACLRRARPWSVEFHCVNCRTPFPNASPLEAGGRWSLTRLGLRGLDAAYCFGDYDGALRELIHLFQYGKAQSLAGPLSILPADRLPRDDRFDCIAPAPPARRRRWHRGFNQGEVLTGWLSRRAGRPVLRALRRARATESQAGLRNSRRRRGAPIEGKRILLADDVMTNGSTGAACATTFERAGAAKVASLAAAQVVRRMDGRQARAAAAATGDV